MKHKILMAWIFVFLAFPRLSFAQEAFPLLNSSTNIFLPVHVENGGKKADTWCELDTGSDTGEGLWLSVGFASYLGLAGKSPGETHTYWHRTLDQVVFGQSIYRSKEIFVWEKVAATGDCFINLNLFMKNYLLMDFDATTMFISNNPLEGVIAGAYDGHNKACQLGLYQEVMGHGADISALQARLNNIKKVCGKKCKKI